MKSMNEQYSKRKREITFIALELSWIGILYHVRSQDPNENIEELEIPFTSLGS